MRVHEPGITWFLDRSFTESRIDITDDIIADEMYDEKAPIITNFSVIQISIEPLILPVYIDTKDGLLIPSKG